MREARTPQEGCGPLREGPRRRQARRAARALLRAFVIAGIAAVANLGHTQVAHAQDADIATGNGLNKKKNKSSFGAANAPGTIFGKINTNIDRAQPMRLQGDQLIYDKSGDRVISRGNVEIFYNN